MALEKFLFEEQSLNTSLQVGDSVYYASQQGVTITDPIFFGTVFLIHDYGVNFAVEIDVAQTGLVPSHSFILFSKTPKANEAGVKGYYADVTMENDSKKRVELFAVGAEVYPSSK
jgi:hypothetical protein